MTSDPRISMAPSLTRAERKATARGVGVSVEDKRVETDQRVTTFVTSSEDAASSQYDRMRRIQVTDRF